MDVSEIPNRPFTAEYFSGKCGEQPDRRHARRLRRFNTRPCIFKNDTPAGATPQQSRGFQITFRIAASLARFHPPAPVRAAPEIRPQTGDVSASTRARKSPRPMRPSAPQDQRPSRRLRLKCRPCWFSSYLSISAASGPTSIPGRKYSIVPRVGRPCEKANTSPSGNR